MLNSAEPGDVRSVCEVFAALPKLKKTIARSEIRGFAKAVGETLRNANLETLCPPIFDTNLVILGTLFPGDARAAFDSLDAGKIGEQLCRSLPRSWRQLGLFAWSTDLCNPDLAQRIIQNTDFLKLEQQIKKYALSNRYELRVLLHFLARGSDEHRHFFARRLREIVIQACAPKDAESDSLIQAYARLDSDAGSTLAQQLGLEVADNRNQGNREEFEQRYRHLIEKYRDADALGLDYDLEIYGQGTTPEINPAAVQSNPERGE